MAERTRKLTRHEEEKQREQDLMKMELALDIYSPLFEQFIVQLNGRIKQCLSKVFDDEFENGEVTAKIKISMPELEEPQQVIDGFGEQTTMMRAYKSPMIEHKISLQLKQKSEVDGEVVLREHEIKEVNGEYIAIPLTKLQMSMEEFLQDQE